MSGIDPAAYQGDIVSRLRHWRGLHLAHTGELFEAADDDQPLFAISDTNEPRNGAVDTPDSQPTPAEGSNPSEGTCPPSR